LVVAGTLVLTVAASVLLIKRTAFTTAENEMTPEAQALGDLVSTTPAITGQRIAQVLRRVGGFDALTVVGLSRQGTFGSLPSPLRPAVLNANALLSGDTVSGRICDEIFAAVPVSLTRREIFDLGIPAGSAPVLVLTRHVDSPVKGFGYFLLITGIVLVFGAVVAAVLAARISAPLREAVDATGKIAGGDLEARVPIRPHDYPEVKQLAVSINTMGESLARSQGLGRQFLLSVSHELRTPLTSIRGYADALADGTTDDTDAALSIIGGEARRLDRLVRDLLDLARLDARQFSFHTERLDCVDLVSAVASGFRPEIGAAGVTLETFLPDDTELWVDADPDRLGQVVANLVENAYKFASTKVIVGTGLVGDVVVIWVVDDGPGIAPDDLPRVFERHFASDRVPTRKLGTGLGLAIVSELTEAMGSRCTAESPVSDGRGTRMTVWLEPKSAPAAIPEDALLPNEDRPGG
jgi:signal transduction histidine kinase